MVINRVTEPYLFDDRDLRARSADAQTEQSVPRNEKFYYSSLMDFADAMVPVALCKFKDDCCGGSSGAARRGAHVFWERSSAAPQRLMATATATAQANNAQINHNADVGYVYFP